MSSSGRISKLSPARDLFISNVPRALKNTSNWRTFWSELIGWYLLYWCYLI